MSDSIVRLMHYDPRWRQEFQQTRSNVLHSCQGYVRAVEHIGSTAVSGLVARPTIDLLAGLAEDEHSADTDVTTEASLLIEGLNFLRSQPHPWADDAVVLNKPRRGSPTHRIFLMKIGCPAWARALAIRDALRADAELRIRFEETKVARWRVGQGDPDRYQRDKAAFFTHLVDQIGGHGG